MLSRISKDKNNNVKHHFELAASAYDESDNRRRRSSEITPPISRRPSIEITPPISRRPSRAGDDDDADKEIKELLDTLIKHTNDIVDLYNKEYYNKSRMLTETECTALIGKFNTLETAYNASKEILSGKKLSEDDIEYIKDMDSTIGNIKIIVFTYCRNTKVEDKDIEEKLAELDNIITEGTSIINDNYGYGMGSMNDANCKAMRDWCDKTIPDFRKKLEDLRGRVMKNGSLPYKKRLDNHDKYLKDLETKYKNVINNKCKGKL
jgi:hypothetical protein